MSPDDIRRLPAATGASIARSNEDESITRKREMTASGALLLGAELYEYARRLRPDWPSEEERAEDLGAHVRVTRMLQSVAPKLFG